MRRPTRRPKLSGDIVVSPVLLPAFGDDESFPSSLVVLASLPESLVIGESCFLSQLFRNPAVASCDYLSASGRSP